MKPKKPKKGSRRPFRLGTSTNDKTEVQSLQTSKISEESHEIELSEEKPEEMHKFQSPNSRSLSSAIGARFSKFELGEPTSSAMKSHEVNNTRTASVQSGLASHLDIRDSNLSATYASKRNSSKKGRNMSYSQVPSASFSSQPPPGVMEIRPDLFKSVLKGSHDISLINAPRFELPKFRPLTDLSIMNSLSAIKNHFFNPTFQVFRYNNYLDILSDHHLSDSINFATVRNHSLLKFISRHKASKKERELHHGIKPKNDIRYYEGILSYELLKCRSFLRRLIRMQSCEELLRSTIISSEELLQANFINYVRFLVGLPTVLPVPPEHLDEILATHYKFKSFFSEMSDALYTLKKDGYGDEVSTAASDLDLLLQAITKVSYEYILLEKYHIHILVKLNNNYLIENRITKHLFTLFDLNMKLENMESLKVLNYNTFFSAQYSWYLAITIPFVRVFEANVFNEHRGLVNDREAYYNHYNETSARKETFKELDHELFRSYFKHLDFKDYNSYNSLSRKDLVLIHKTIENKSDKYRGLGLDDPSSSFSHKPMNFEYYSKSLSTIASETFHVIQTRDITIQLTPLNYKVILSEFHRILKKGGILEMPLFKSGDQAFQHREKSKRSEFQDLSKIMDVEVASHFDLIPRFIETLFGELSTLFGPKNVKFSPALLSSQTEVNSFLFKHIGQSLYEIIGDIDGFCSRFADDGTPNPEDEEALHYYFYIRAEKT